MEGGGQGRQVGEQAGVAGTWEEGRRGRGESAICYLLRLPAPPAPLSLGTFCCGPSTSCA